MTDQLGRGTGSSLSQPRPGTLIRSHPRSSLPHPERRWRNACTHTPYRRLDPIAQMKRQYYVTTIKEKRGGGGQEETNVDPPNGGGG